MGGAMNPFTQPEAVAHSNYSRYESGHLVRAETREAASPLSTFVHDGLRALILNDQFVCVGGKSAFRHGSYRFGLYPELGSPVTAAGLARDLFTFVEELPSFGDSLSTYVASFAGPHPADEAAFERHLWQTLQALHDLDAPHHHWDPAVSDDPVDPAFSFSFGGVAFFVIGMHAASSRIARRFAWPTLIFNPHRQFEALRQAGDFDRFRQVIRRGETRLQGDANPMLADYGTRSEAMQYSGRRVSAAWRCPFHTRPSDDATKD
jgi:FPC/CPF motif-containing protein YcgG